MSRPQALRRVRERQQFVNSKIKVQGLVDPTEVEKMS